MLAARSPDCSRRNTVIAKPALALRQTQVHGSMAVRESRHGVDGSLMPASQFRLAGKHFSASFLCAERLRCKIGTRLKLGRVFS
jgi:hypothetical protein